MPSDMTSYVFMFLYLARKQIGKSGGVFWMLDFLNCFSNYNKNFEETSDSVSVLNGR